MKFVDLKYNKDGLIPAIIEDTEGQVLMLAYMNHEAFNKTMETGFTWFYSRSRKQLWQKGETSGHVQKVKCIVTDCDYDTLLITVEQHGKGACHEGYRSCFHNPIVTPEDYKADKTFDPQQVYGPQVLQQLYAVIVGRKHNPKPDSYTNYLLHEGLDKILKKVGEEASEVIIAAKNVDNGELIYEAGDLLYHLLVLLVNKGIELEEIWQELSSRAK